MSSTVSIARPGIALGKYPERKDVDSCKWDKAAFLVKNQLFNSKYPSLAKGYEFVKKVEEENSKLTNLSDEELQMNARILRQELSIKGQTDELLVKVFALVRESAGRTLGMYHYKSQLLGGWVMAQGKLAEMETGEGKTLTATLPACTAALTGIPVHIITVNDYLVMRDAEIMRPIYDMLGLTVGTITENSSPEERKHAYSRDITYCTGQQVVFDYLRDRLIRNNSNSKLKLQIDNLHNTHSVSDRLVLRGLCYAIIDEADSIFIDEARTPFILSKSNVNNEQEQISKQAFEITNELLVDKHYIINTFSRVIEFTQIGKQIIKETSKGFGKIWNGSVRREELVRHALFAQLLLERDKDYLVRDGKVQIIDQNTGRIMPDRSWSFGLQQMVETKENCEITGQNQTLSRITYQEFFRKYLTLSGMSGTLKEVKNELHAVYEQEIIAVPPHKQNIRKQYPTMVFKTNAEKWNVIVEEICVMHSKNRPILVGTCSVADSEKISMLLTLKGLNHQVLNARQDKHEAEVISQAGQLNQISIATNMAGRGTDIKLSAEAECLGGLHVLITQRNESKRIDRQLIGRCARQGDRGSFQAILSLQDDIVQSYYSTIAKNIISKLTDTVVRKFGDKILLNAQSRIETLHARMRKNVIRSEPHHKKMFSFTSTS